MTSRYPRALPALGALLTLASALPFSAQAQNVPSTFVNPIRTDFGADPWLAQRDGFYYFVTSTGSEIIIAKARTLSEMVTAPFTTVWKKPEQGPNSRNVWSPELHFLNGKWWVYYSATAEDGNDDNRRVFCLESEGADPLGNYTDRGRVEIPGVNAYTTDGTIFQKPDGSLYFFYAGREKAEGSKQNLFVCAMSDPHTLKGRPLKLSSPQYDWEKNGWEGNENPEVIEHNGQTFVTYSASAGASPDYCLGLLYNPTSDLLNADAWSKSPVPVFSRYSGPEGNTYTPGHNGFFKSPDGTEDWMVFHGKEIIDYSWERRLARVQKFTWNPNGLPNFGFPIPAMVPLNVPAGEAGSQAERPLGGTGLRAQYFVVQGDTPTFDTPFLKDDGQNIDFNWNEGAPREGVEEDYFAIRWTGQIQPRYSGLYTFQTFADEGIRVTVDGSSLIDDLNVGTQRAGRGFIYLEANRKYPIQVDYFDKEGPARASLYWQSQNQAFEPVPRDCLFPPAN